MTKATGLAKLEKLLDQKTQVLTADEQESYAFYIDRCRKAKEQREQRTEFFDELTYEEDYRLNRQALNSYLRPRLNDDEVRVNTGLIEKKIEAVHNELLSMNIQPEVRAFDEEDKEIVKLGDNFNDIVKRTNEMERDEDVKKQLIQELLSQRAVFVEELWIDEVVTEKGNKRKVNGRPKKRRTQMCKKRLVSGMKMFLGDITIPAYDFNKQPYIIKYDKVTYKEAESTYGDHDNWKYVQPGVHKEDWIQDFDYRMGVLEDEEVEIIQYFSYPDDEYQIIINGVLMLKPGTPLPYDFDGYHITMQVLKPMSTDFAYGKPLTASAKVLAALNNETIRLMIRKWRQAIEPPLAVPNAGKVFSRDIWQPASVTQGIRAGDFERLIDHDGVTNSEFQMYNLIEQKATEFVGVPDLFQGMSGEKVTATQSVQQMKQAVKQLGLAVSAYMAIIRDCTWLRIFNVLENYVYSTERKYDPILGKVVEINKGFTIDDADLGGGKRGKKIIKFAEEDLEEGSMEEAELYRREEESEREGKPFKMEFINAKKLRNMNVNWFVVAHPKERDGSALSQIMFQDMFAQAQNVSQTVGMPIDGGKAIEMFEQKWDAKGLFQKQAPDQVQPGEEPESLGIAEQAQAIKGTPTGAEMKAGAGAGTTKKPSINTMLGQTQ